MNKLFLLGLLFSLVLSIGLVVACGDDDDDDDNDTAVDDDDTAALTCADVFGEMYTCGYVFTDADGVEIPEADVVAACEAGDPADYALGGDLANCVVDNTGDCDAIGTCLEGLL